jgi:hypothetical protein
MIRWQYPNCVPPPGFEHEWGMISKELLNGDATVTCNTADNPKPATAAAIPKTVTTSMLQKLKLAGAIVILAGQTLWMLIRNKPIPKD